MKSEFVKDLSFDERKQVVRKAAANEKQFVSRLFKHYAQQGYDIDDRRKYRVEKWKEATHGKEETSTDVMDHWVSLRAVKTGHIELLHVANMHNDSLDEEIASAKRDQKKKTRVSDWDFRVYNRLLSHMRSKQRGLCEAYRTESKIFQEMSKRPGYTGAEPTITQRLFVINLEPNVTRDIYVSIRRLQLGDFHFYHEDHELQSKGVRVFRDKSEFWSTNGHKFESVVVVEKKARRRFR